MIAALAFTPLIAWPILAALAIAAAIPIIAGLASRAAGATLRTALATLILVTLAGPQWRETTSKALPDIAIILVDHSQSMTIGARAAMAATALAALRATAGNTIVKIAEIPPADSGGTSLTPTLANALSTVQPAQLAGIIAITDGETDQPSLPTGTPFSTLLSATAEETDRELRVLNAPAYGLVDHDQPVTFEILDHGTTDAGNVAVTVQQDGTQAATLTVPTGQPTTINIHIRHAGPSIITLTAAPLPGEVSDINDSAALTLNGIMKRLNVLLISGRPDQGERAWRLLLKSDPAVNLVHFTILRTPGEAIDANAEDLALVPFPIKELFETDINKFNLIILDGFIANGLLPPAYLGNIATFVKNGGALLTEVGPEFATADSLAFSPLAEVLPAQPAAAGTVDISFPPTITALGGRHPVTAPFANAPLAAWYRLESATAVSGDVLMTGPQNLPLLILSDAGQGRSAILLSDQLWLWTRGGAHEGPALPLLRRIVHYLLREPALEPESLSATLTATSLTINRQTLSPSYPGDAHITAPDGHITTQPLTASTPGHYAATLPIPPTPGTWKVRQGTLTAFAATTQPNAQEFQDLAATSTQLAPISRHVIWLGQTPTPKLPDLITPRHAAETTGTRNIPLLPPLPTLAFAMLLLAAAWWRDSRP
jgi:hypothetical protein